MPLQEPQVGQASSSIVGRSSSETEVSAAAIIGSIRSSLRPLPAIWVLPASIGPPETKTVGMLSRMAASSMPGVILSQLETQISASAQWALTMYSTASAISSREGSEVEHAAVAHRDAVVDGDGVELAGDRAGLPDRPRHDVADLAEVDVAGHELGEAVGNRDDGLAEVASGYTGRPEQGPGTGHVPAVSDRSRPEGGHGQTPITRRSAFIHGKSVVRPLRHRSQNVKRPAPCSGAGLSDGGLERSSVRPRCSARARRSRRP